MYLLIPVAVSLLIVARRGAVPADRPEGGGISLSCRRFQPRVLHVVGVVRGQRSVHLPPRALLESVDRADRSGVRLLASAPEGWARTGWERVSLSRDARVVGDPSPKAFLEDLFDLALARSQPYDWLLYSNSDLAVLPGFYAELLSTRGSVVEYMRREASADADTLDGLLASAGELYGIGIDGFALRASVYASLRDVLPDFVIGEPYWDTAWSEVLRRLLPVRRDTKSLVHPRHPQVWDMANPTPAGKHNEKLYVAALVRGNAPYHHIVEQPDRTDTAVVVTSFGSDPSRLAASAEGLRRQLRQDLYADVYLVELVVEDGPGFPDDVLAQVRHLPLQGDASCLDLFQKEALQNVGWRTAAAEGDYEHFIFVDADVFAVELDWFSRIRERLRDDPSRAVQGFRLVTDPADSEFDRASVGAAFALGQQTDLTLNPGICWGLHRQLLELGDGLNPFCIDCAGDSAFVVEYLNTPTETYDPWLFGFRWFREIERDLPFSARLDCVPVDLVHVNHGPHRDRNYQAVRYAIDGFPPVRELVELGDDGLLRWRDPDCVERQLLRLRRRLSSRDAVDLVFREHGYVGRERVAPGPRIIREKPIVELKSPHPVSAEPDDRLLDAPPDRLPIFDPHAVYRTEWPFSWCDNVESTSDTTYVPLGADSEPPVLRLRPVSADRSVVMALATRPTWETVDLRRFASLELSVHAEGVTPEVVVWLTSRSEEGADAESARVSLGQLGLLPRRLQQFSIRLSDLETVPGFDLGRARQVLVLGQGCELLEVSRMSATSELTEIASADEPVVTLPAGRGSTELGRVRIEAGTVVASTGERLRGVPVWIYKWGSVNGLTDHARDPAFYAGLPELGVNAVRIVCFDAWQRSRGFPHYEFDSNGVDRVRFLEELDAAVDLATRAGLYALVNYHDTGRLDVEHCSTFWRLVAGRYADWANVLYELANEPVAWCPGDWGDAEVHAQEELFSTVRSLAPETHVTVCSFANTEGGRRSIGDVASALEIDWSNASLGFHCYETGGTSAPLVAARERFAVVCTEVDVPASSGGDAHVVPMDGEPWSTQTLERLGISWFAWRANGPEEVDRNFRHGFLADARRRGYAWVSDG